MFGGLLNALAGGAAGAGGRAMGGQPFSRHYRCFPVAYRAGQENLEGGDKILLPASALDDLARRHVTYPLLFQACNPSMPQKKTHVGVMEFSAEEGVAYVPYWIMQNLLIQDGGMILLTNVTLAKGTFCKLQPHNKSFTDLSNPRVILERSLRGFSCLTKGDTIQILHDNVPHYLDIVELKPADAVTVIETDLNVEFAPPMDMAKEEARMAAEAKKRKAALDASASAAQSNAQATSIKFGASAKKNADGDDDDDYDDDDGDDGQAGGDGDSESKLNTSSSSSYFAKLGSGHKLGNSSKKKKKKKKRKTSEKSNTDTLNTSTASATSTASNASAPTTPVTLKRKSVVQNGFRYIYEVHPTTGRERLIRRVKLTPSAAAASADGASSAGDGGSGSFTPFGGKGYSLK